MIDKRLSSPAEAVARIESGSVVLIGGFGEAGSPIELIHALIDCGTGGLTVVNNNAGNGEVGLAALIGNGQVRKMICSYPRSSHSKIFPELYRAGRIELEVVPQGTLAERIRAAGAGIPAFFTPTAVGTPLADGKELREFDGKTYVLERSLKADYALIKCEVADLMGNLTYSKTARNFGPIMATAARTTIVQARRVVEPGGIDPEHVVTPGVFVDVVVEVPEPLQEFELIGKGERYP
jgi:3-oxoadipate CoA-transferase alpha subunit